MARLSSAVTAPLALLGLLPWYGWALLGVLAAIGRRTGAARPHG